MPSNVDKQTVKKLVQQQIEAGQPIRAPWYREGTRQLWSGKGRGSRKSAYNLEQQTAHPYHAQVHF